MALPKIAKVTYELTVPSTGKKIKFRPYLVKEEKVLVLARESEDPKQMALAIQDVIKACVQTRGFKIEELGTFDIEYIFLNIRQRSVGENVDVVVTCPDDGKTTVDVTIFLDEIQVAFDESHEKNIKLDDSVSIQMKYPTMDMVLDTDIDNVSVEQSLALIAGCIEQIYTEEESYTAADSTQQELIEWVEDLEPTQFAKLERFFETMPKLSHTIKVTNPVTGVENEIVMEGLGSFFA